MRVDPPSVAGRVPPHDLDAEAAALSAELLDAEALTKVLELLRPENFYSEANARIHQACEQLRRGQTPVDMITVASWLRDRGWLERCGGTAYLAQLADATPAIGHVEAHAAKVLETFERRQLIATCQRVSAELYGDVGPWEEYKSNVRPELGRLTAPRVKLAGAPIGAAVDAARAHIREAIEGRVIGVRYPWRCVHELVGLLVAERQTVLAGIAGHGKTTWAQQVAQAVASTPADETDIGEAVYFLTGEMPRVALLTRWACSLAGLDARRVEGGAIDAGEQERLGTWLGMLEELPIIIDDEPASAATVARRVKAHQAEFAAGRARTAKGALLGRCRLRLVIGDHAQELEKHEQGRERVERVERCALGWRDEIAKGCKAATLLLSQLRPPTPDEWKLSPRFPPWPVRERLFYAPTEITASADTLIAVQRPERLMRGKVPAKWIGVAAVSILKGRFGDDTTRALLGFDGGFFSEDLPAAMRQALSPGDDDE